jgi:two-component system, chemotaxis family, response regulator Rcp1
LPKGKTSPIALLAGRSVSASKERLADTSVELQRDRAREFRGAFSGPDLVCSKNGVSADHEPASREGWRTVGGTNERVPLPDTPASAGMLEQWRRVVMTEVPNSEPINILMVEDNPGDARLALEALKESKIQNVLHHVRDGVEAMRFLHKEGEYDGMPTPDLILLDLNMPRKDGREVLSEIKEDPDLRLIPVVVLTTSAAERDLVKSYDLHANAYVVKPIDLERFIEIVKAIEGFWFYIVKLPPERGD